MKTIADILQISTLFLKEKKIENPRLQAEEMLSFVLKMKRMDLYMQFDRPLEETELALLREMVKKRVKGEPLGYIFGEVDFFGCRLKINSSVLIPRQETEILVSKILERSNVEKREVWDVCCGSGCIGISLKKARPQWSVIMSDISEGAIQIAKENAQLNALEIEILKGDLLVPFKGRKADLFVCNPPYIKEADFHALSQEVSLFEPTSALIGGKTGFEFYEKLEAVLPDFLNIEAQLFFEIGTGMGDGIKKIFSNKKWGHLHVEHDWAGHTRYFFAQKT